MRQLYLIRHGQASYGAADYDQLSEQGREQSRLLGAWFKRCGIEVHHAVTGALNRHVQTAQAFFAGYGETAERMARLRRDPDFNELDAGDVLNPAHAKPDSRTVPPTGGNASMSFAEFQACMRPAFLRWASGRHDHEYRDPFPLFSARCTGAALRALEQARPGENVAAFSSGGTIAMICRHALGLGDEATSALMWCIGNTSVTRLSWDQERLALTLFNSTAHLDHTGDASLVTLT